ncbi:MAG: hypothetical protein AUH85_10915 [Chloroflexi bacterium 13_1_40CM_4_68_4]|nr:MAG: hypothetical protein AUH85_10915 [Chloroflexi bacterium 13_1_40CM_4_68_4]
MVRPVVAGEASPSNGGTALSPVRRERIPESIVAQIQQRLERGEIKPGDQLPSERVLAEQLQVSRPSVREALRSLELLGVTESRPGGGTFMRVASPDALLRPLAALTRAHDIEDILEVRALLEPALAELAARRANDDDIAALRTILVEQEQKVARRESFVEEDTRFHYLVAQAAKNELVLRMLGVIMDVLRASREEWLQSPERARASLEGHRVLLAAIELHDGEAARAASADHVHHVGEGVMTLIGSEPKRSRR